MITNEVELKDNEFIVIQKLLFDECGINLNDSKKTMVATRLFKRLNHYQVNSYADYIKIVHISQKEKAEFINALSTNETYFFRETAHFDFLTELASKNDSLKVWSAAASMGAEAYSISFILDHYLDKNKWAVYGSDINTEVLNIAAKGLYPFKWADKIPEPYRSQYCLKGSGRYENKMLIDRPLLENINFFRHNLLENSLEIGEFDVIFLRNVLLYFNEETKLKVINNILPNLKKNGYLIISLTETFQDKDVDTLEFIGHNIYQKVTR
jgi:chemotaxis protein methyltransferase CheR